MELQNTLQDLSNRVGNVGGENGKLKTENAVLCEYIDRLMQAEFLALKHESRILGHSSNPVYCF